MYYTYVYTVLYYKYCMNSWYCMYVTVLYVLYVLWDTCITYVTGSAKTSLMDQDFKIDFFCLT